MINATCKLMIEEKEYDITVNVGKMVSIERATGKSFMKNVQEAQQGSIEALVNLLAACLEKNGKQVGFNFINNMEFEIFEELCEPLVATILKAFPEKKEDNKKKVVVLTPMK